MRPPCPQSGALVALLALALSGRPAHAQHQGHDAAGGAEGSAAADGARGWRIMAQAIPLVTRARHTAGGGTLTEGYLSQPLLMAHGAWLDGRLRLDAALNGEGVTLRRGELSTGGFGEGYVDRRHPHTYVHELMLSGVGALRGLSWSVSAGRGFAPFGTDDPMMRPLEKFPINHHLSQILERGLVVGAVRAGRVILEGGTFTGEEPESPSSLPIAARFGDSWAVRATLLPTAWSELQASYASVVSPEERASFGLDQRKQSVSARSISPDGRRYLLAEWARTVDRDPNRDVDVFAYETVLVEGSAMIGRVGVAVRLEQTERPEEERLADPFRTLRPHIDLGITGITRWRAASLALTMPSVTGDLIAGFPFVEVQRFGVAARDERATFSPQDFYGSRPPWMATAGVRLRYGPLHARMGRYGVARPQGPAIATLGGGADAAHRH